MNNALETQTVTKVYGTEKNVIYAVNEVSLQVHEGEFMALVGPSGSGKTTMLSMLAALLRPSQGQIFIDGHNLADMSDAQRTRFRREKIGFTFQANNLLPFLTARENVELMLRLNNQYDSKSARRVTELMERLGLGERMDSLPRQLSGGQQQRVAIARALVHNPAVVLADEPTAALDTERAHQVVRTFADLIHEQKRAGIMVTHDLRMAQYADRVVEMMDGRIAREYQGRSEIERLDREHKLHAVPNDVPASAGAKMRDGMPQPVAATA